MRSLTPRLFAGLFLIAAAALFTTTGCERKEKIVDIETPRRDIELERDIDTGEVDLEVERKD